ncbi:inter-alpha-trypsin inhibitor heavy chain H5-like isoform X1 [Arapaima gigas]
MRLFSLLLCVSPLVCGHHTDSLVSDQGAHTVPHRLPRQVRRLFSKETNPYIQELSVKTTIISRYAFTAVSCTMFNKLSAARLGIFRMEIPASAFISNFTMIVAGRVFPSQIKAKEKKAKQQNGISNQALKEGQEGKGSKREVEMFQAAATVPGKNRAVFLLTYEELLVRRRGLYEHVTIVRPQQLVGKLSVQVVIVEHSEITHLEVLPLRNGLTPANKSTADSQGRVGPPVSTVIQQNKTFCNISFSPSIAQQAAIATSGVLGDFIVQYDVKRELGIGEVQVLDGHFVHYFAPKDLPVVPKNVVFVIDTSASMLGTKIRQTKEALFTILRDLRPNDYFNFVSFSSRIKVWKPGKLVPVTPNNIRDAKKFIHLVSPTGATNINLAIETGSGLLRNHLSSEGSNCSSVSLLIFLTDGRPTVGEVQPPRILSNAQLAVQEQFCIFTIGLGDDVDYRLLQRLALDNCGTMRRIPEQADASAMLKGFYDEIGTPLLSDVRIEYSQDAVEYVTQHLFSNYFNGSEIVIAGKLTNQSADSIHVQVTASNSNGSVVLESDVMLREREKEMEQHIETAGLGPLGDKYVERLWGFLSVKDSLKSRLLSQSSQERDESTQQATNLSLTYNFLTPLTTMVVETPSVEVRDPVSDSIASPSTETTGESTQSLPSDTKPLGECSAMSPMAHLARFNSTADGDPHFVVEFPLSKLTMCFNINGEPGHVLRLVSDHKHSGVTVNGMLVGAPAPVGAHKQQRTYFSTIAVVVDRPKRVYLEITPYKVTLNGTDQLVLPCNTTAAMEFEELSLTIIEQSNVTITIQGTITFVILIHLYKNPAPFQRDHLGFYISNNKGLSENCHGLLGQFLYQDVSLTQMFGNVPGPMNNTDLKLPRSSQSKVPNNTLPLPKSSYFKLSNEITRQTSIGKATPPHLVTLTLQPELLKNTTGLYLPTIITQPKVLMQTKQHNTVMLTTQPVSPKYVQLSVPSKSSRFKRSTRTPTTGPTLTTQHQRLKNSTQLQVLKNTAQPKSPTEIMQKNSENPNIVKNVTQAGATKTLPFNVLAQAKQPIIQNNTQPHTPKSIQPKIPTKTMEPKVLTENSPPRTLTKVPNDMQQNFLTNGKQPSVPTKSKQLDIPTWSTPLKIVTKSMQPNTESSVLKKSPQLNTLSKTMQPVVVKNNTQPRDPTKTTKPSVPTKTTQLNNVTKTTESMVVKNNTQPRDPTKTTQLNNVTKTTEPMVVKNNTQSNVPIKTTKPSDPVKNTESSVLKKSPQLNALSKTMQPMVVKNNTQPRDPTKTTEPMVVKNNTQPNDPAKTAKPSDPAKNTESSVLKKNPQLNALSKTMQPMVVKNNTQPRDPTKTTKPSVPTKTTQLNNVTKTTEPMVVKNNTQPRDPTKTTKPSVPIKTTQLNNVTKTIEPMVVKNNTQSNVPIKTTKPSDPVKNTESSVLKKSPQLNALSKTMQPMVVKNNTQPNDPAKTAKPSDPAKNTESSNIRNNVPAKNSHPNVITRMRLKVPNGNSHPNISTNLIQSTTSENILPSKVQREATKPQVSTVVVHPKNSRNSSEPKAQQNYQSTHLMEPTNITRLNAPMKTAQPMGVVPNNTAYNVLLNTTEPEILLNASLTREAKVPVDTVSATLDPLNPLVFPGLKIKGRTISVTQKTRKMYGGKERVECWFVKNSASKLIDGQYEDYVVPHLFYTSDNPHGNN